MPLPTYPQNFLPRPFADNGAHQLIPDDKAASGRASFKEGFPTETQLPLNSGGIAPNRTDFNGILHILSALAFWQQSGGQWAYSATRDYNVPCVVYYDAGQGGRLWWCLMPNGPSSVTPGVVSPGTNDEVWQDLYGFLRKAGSGGGGGGGEEALEVDGYLTEFRTFYEQTPPVGWAIRNGALLSAADQTYPDLWEALALPRNSWKLKTEAQWAALRSAAGGVGGAPFFVLDTTARTIRLPDTRGDYERNTGGGTMANVGQWHGDAIRNLTGQAGYVPTGRGGLNAGPITVGSGTLYVAEHSRSNFYVGAHEGWAGYLYFDASRLSPTAAENRTRAFGVLGCVYIGGN